MLFMNLTMSAFPMSSFNSWFILILQYPSLSCTGPKISSAPRWKIEIKLDVIFGGHVIIFYIYWLVFACSDNFLHHINRIPGMLLWQSYWLLFIAVYAHKSVRKLRHGQLKNLICGSFFCLSRHMFLLLLYCVGPSEGNVFTSNP